MKKWIVFIVSFIVGILIFNSIFTMADRELDFPDKDDDSMRFVSYNMMFGMSGRSGVMNALGHLSFHGLHSVALTKAFSGYGAETIDMLAVSDADVIVLNEVLGTLRRDAILEGLRDSGFVSFCWGPAEHHDKPLDIGTLVASKEVFAELEFSMPQKSEMGGGAGACAVYFEEKGLVVLGVHLGTFNDELIMEQVDAIESFVAEQLSLGRRVVLMGDFNQEFSELSPISGLDFSPSISSGTCPNIEELRPFSFSAVDNILYSEGMRLIDAGTLDGYSDHKLVWSDLELGF